MANLLGRYGSSTLQTLKSENSELRFSAFVQNEYRILSTIHSNGFRSIVVIINPLHGNYKFVFKLNFQDYKTKTCCLKLTEWQCFCRSARTKPTVFTFKAFMPCYTSNRTNKGVSHRTKIIVVQQVASFKWHGNWQKNSCQFFSLQ